MDTEIKQLLWDLNWTYPNYRFGDNQDVLLTHDILHHLLDSDIDIAIYKMHLYVDNDESYKIFVQQIIDSTLTILNMN